MSSTGSSRGNPSMGDVLRSVFVLGLIVLALWGIGQFFTSEPERPVRAVDYASTAASARDAAQFELLAPDSLPDGWISNSARFSPDEWNLGVLTDDDEYIGLTQALDDADDVIERYAEDSTPDGESTVAGREWSVRSEPDGDLTYVRVEGDLVTLVTGSAPREQIEGYIESLSAS